MKTKPAIAPTSPAQTLTPGQKALRAIVQRQIDREKLTEESDQLSKKEENL